MIDPTDVRQEQVTGTVSMANLPVLTKIQRDFGYVPDLSALRAGDLILTQDVGLSPKAAAIAHVQTLQNPETARWTHAAIYATGWRVFEATVRYNVASGNMLSWMPKTRVLVRRPVAFDRLPAPEAELAGLRLVMEAALLQSTAKYGLGAVLSIPWRLLGRSRGHAPAGESRAASMICSGLYSKCYSVSSGAQLLTVDMLRSDEPITPALLAGLDTLTTIRTGWLKLV